MIMSYFYAPTVTQSESFVGKRAGKRYSKHGASAYDDADLEPVHGSRHRRRHASRTRQVSKPKLATNHVNESCDMEKSSTTKTKSKRHLQREIQRLVEENRELSSRLELSIGDSGMLDHDSTKELAEKDTLITKLKQKNQKLEAICREINAEYEKVKSLVAQREMEYQDLHAHHGELTELVGNVEQERKEFLKVIQKLKSENIQRAEDINLLKNLVYRLNVEIERYQDKLRRTDRNDADPDNRGETRPADPSIDDKKVIESWGRVEIHALGPLLDAYQENLAEKDELIKKYGIEIEEFSGRCKDIVIENETLWKKNKDLFAENEKYCSEIEQITRDAAIVKEQNELLGKQVASQKQKLLEIHSAYEQKVESMTRENNKLHKDYVACKSELSNIQGKYEILSESFEKMKNNSERTLPLSVHVAAVDECKRLFEELKIQYESDKQKLTNRIMYLEETGPDNEKQLITITAERDHLKTWSKNLEKNLKRTQHKLEHLQNSTYSIQVSRDSLKRQLNKTTGYCEELLAEQERLIKEKEEILAVLKEREKENENYQYLGDNIVHRMGNLKHQLKSVQEGAKQQLATVEKHLKIKEEGADQLKAECEREVQRLKQLLRQKEDTIGKLQREKYATRDNLELVWRAATSGNKKVEDVLKNTKIYNI